MWYPRLCNCTRYKWSVRDSCELGYVKLSQTRSSPCRPSRDVSATPARPAGTSPPLPALASLLSTPYFSAIRFATALAPRNSEFQLCDEDACFFRSRSLRALKSVEAAGKGRRRTERVGQTFTLL